MNKDITDYNKIFVQGVPLPLYISNQNAITDDAVFVKGFEHIKTVFVKRFYDGFIEQVLSLSKYTKLRVRDISVRYYKRRWGCCDKKGNLVFNYLLFMLPEELQRYVIIHELCHTVYFNHSAEFWKLVERFQPDYKKLRQQLKSFDFITNLY